jgi:hypothetical protein
MVSRDNNGSLLPFGDDLVAQLSTRKFNCRLSSSSLISSVVTQNIAVPTDNLYALNENYTLILLTSIKMEVSCTSATARPSHMLRLP